MKHFLFSAMVVFMSAFAAVSCHCPYGDDDDVVASISADEITVTYGFARSEQQLNVRSTVKWTAETEADWIHLTQTEYTAKEKHVLFVVDGNPTKDPRQATITVSCAGGDVVLTVNQEGGHPVDVALNHYDITSEGGKLKILMTADTDVEVNVTEGAEWLTFKEAKGIDSSSPYMIFEAAANENDDERQATVLVKAEGASDDLAVTLTMTQKSLDQFQLATLPNHPDGEPERNVQGSEESELTFYFASNVSYLERISHPSWIIPHEATDVNPAEYNPLKYTILKSTEYDERVGTIRVVQYGDNTEMALFTITQSGNPILQVDQSFIDADGWANGIASSAQTFNVKVTHNLPEGPIASSSADWLTLTPSDEGFTLHITKNESASNRVATFTFSDPNGKAWPVYMNLTQKP